MESTSLISCFDASFLTFHTLLLVIIVCPLDSFVRNIYPEIDPYRDNTDIIHVMIMVTEITSITISLIFHVEIDAIMI